MAKFVINMCEAITAIRAQYQLPESVEIEIDEDCIETNTSLWHEVPSNWNHMRAPDLVYTYAYANIDVMYRNGDIETRHVSSFHGDYWKQENSDYDIVKFRKAQI